MKPAFRKGLLSRKADRDKGPQEKRVPAENVQPEVKVNPSKLLKPFTLKKKGKEPTVEIDPVEESQGQLARSNIINKKQALRADHDKEQPPAMDLAKAKLRPNLKLRKKMLEQVNIKDGQESRPTFRESVVPAIDNQAFGNLTQQPEINLEQKQVLDSSKKQIQLERCRSLASLISFEIEANASQFSSERSDPYQSFKKEAQAGRIQSSGEQSTFFQLGQAQTIENVVDVACQCPEDRNRTFRSRQEDSLEGLPQFVKAAVAVIEEFSTVAVESAKIMPPLVLLSLNPKILFVQKFEEQLFLCYEFAKGDEVFSLVLIHPSSAMLLAIGRLTCLLKHGTVLYGAKETGVLTGWELGSNSSASAQKYEQIVDLIKEFGAGKQGLRLPSISCNHAESYHSSPVVAIAAQKGELLSIDSQGGLCKWHIASQRLSLIKVKAFRGNQRMLINSAAFCGNTMALCTTQGLKMIKLDTLQIRSVPNDSWGDPTACAFADQSLLYTAYEDGSLRMLRVDQGHQVSCALLPDGYHAIKLMPLSGTGLLLVQDVRNSLWFYEQEFVQLVKTESRGKQFVSVNQKEGMLRVWRGCVEKDLKYSGRFQAARATKFGLKQRVADLYGSS